MFRIRELYRKGSFMLVRKQKRHRFPMGYKESNVMFASRNDKDQRRNSLPISIYESEGKCAFASTLWQNNFDLCWRDALLFCYANFISHSKYGTM